MVWVNPAAAVVVTDRATGSSTATFARPLTTGWLRKSVMYTAERSKNGNRREGSMTRSLLTTTP